MENTKPILSDFNTRNYLDEYEGKDALHNNLIFADGRTHESLNGPWHYAVDPYDCCVNQHWWHEKKVSEEGYSLPLDYSFDNWPTMNLPCSWNLFDDKLFWYEANMVFSRRFSFVRNNDEKVFLRIGAANYACRVFINKQYVGMHSGGSTPFMFEITDYLLPDNRIILVVDAARKADRLPMNNTDWFNYGGVYRSIDLYRVPTLHIKDFKIALEPDGSFDKISVSVKLSEKIDKNAEIIME